MENSAEMLLDRISSEIEAYLQQEHPPASPVKLEGEEILTHTNLPVTVVLAELELSAKDYLALGPESEISLEISAKLPVTLQVGAEVIALGELRWGDGAGVIVVTEVIGGSEGVGNDGISPGDTSKTRDDAIDRIRITDSTPITSEELSTRATESIFELSETFPSRIRFEDGDSGVSGEAPLDV